MIEVHLLTEEQKDFLKDIYIDDNTKFNPVFNNGNWIISQEEVTQYNGELEWVKELPLIEYIIEEFDLL